MAFLIRVVGAAAALMVAGLIFPGSVSVAGALWGTVMLTVLYVLLRPLLLAVLLPLNLVGLGLATPFGDGLLVLWTSAWVGGIHISYLQAVAVALMISLANLPYSNAKEQRVLGPRV